MGKFLEYKNKKKDEEEKVVSSSSDRSFGKYSAAKRIGLDTLESDLNTLGSTISNVYSGWQDADTMTKTRTSVEDMQKRLNSYQEYQKKYGGADLSDIASGYQTVLDDWDNLSAMYSGYKSAESYTNERNKLSEIYSMSKNDVAQKLSEGNPIAYTTVGGKDIRWQDLYDDLEHKEMSTSKDGAKGWQKFLADEKLAEEEAAEKEANKKWYEEIGEFLGNSPDTTMISANLSQIVSDKRKDDSYKKPTDDWTEEEQNTFGAYYLLDPEKAYKYATELNNRKASAKNDEQKQSVIDDATSGFWSGLGHTAGALATAPLGLADYLDDLTDMAAGNPVMANENLSPFEYSQAVTGGIGSHLNEKYGTIDEDIFLLGGKGIGDIYGLGTSVAQSALSAYTLGGTGTLVSYFGQGAAAGIDDALSRGATEEQALLYGTILGAAEGISENIGADNLLKIGSADTIKGLFINALKQAGAEGLEETFSSVIGNVADNLIMEENSNFNKAVRQYQAQGLSESEAKNKAWVDSVGDVLYDALAGFASGGIHAGPQTAIATLNEHNENKAIGKQIRENEKVQDLIDLQQTMELQGLNPGESEAYDLYTRYAQKGITSEKIKDSQIGNLFKTSGREAFSTLNSKDSTDIQKADATKRLQTLGKVATPIATEEKARRARMAELNVGEVTEVTSTGNSAKIEGIRKEGDSTIVLTSEGEFKAEEMTFKPKDAEMLSYSEVMDAEKANLFWSQYDGETDVEDYRNSFNMAYSYGEVGFAADTVLKNKGVLTETQASEIYKQSLKMASDRKQKVIDEINEKQKGNTFVKGTFDDSIINYKGTTTDKNKVNWSKLTPQQRSAITFAKGFSKATGVNIKFINSKVVDGKHIGKNGSYNPSTNTIEIDVYAGRIDAKSVTDSIIPTLSHEVTHWMKAKSPAMYDKMKEHIAETLAMKDGKTIEQRVDDEMARMKAAHPDMKVTPEKAIDEMIARSCEDMLSNSEKARELLNGLTQKEQNDLVSKIKDTFKNLIKWVNDLLSNYKSNSEEAKILREYEARLKELSKMWDEALTKAIEANQSLQHEGKTGEQAIGENIFTENTAQLSIRTYENEGRELLHKWLKNSDLDKKTKKEIIEQMDHVYEVATKYAEDNELIDFASWSESDVIRRDDGSPILTVVVPNGDYPLNIDFSQICKKRKALNSVLNALVRSGDLDVRTLSQSDIGNINRIIKEHGFEIACALCFVDSKRYRVNEWADSFTDTYNKLVTSLAKGTEYKVDEFNYTGRNLKQPEGKLLRDADDSELNFDYINEVLAKNASGKAIYRYALAIKNNKVLRSTLNSSEIISSAGLDAIKVQNETLYALVNSHQGSAKPKLSHSENPYGYEILLDSKFNPEDAYKVGGVRIQSFSDYMANMFFDYVQMIGDLSAKQLPAHAYTKEYYFAKLFGLTGIKINLSIVPKGADITDEQKARFNKMTKAAKEKDAEFKKLKAHAGLDVEGNYILEDETFPLDKALELQNTEGYDKNCGIIWVGVSDEHIKKMLDDENIPFIIPYHKSSLNPAIARMRNIDFYNDYTKAQNTRYDTKAKKKVPASIWSFDFYADLAKTNDPKQTTENYKKECADRGYLPKFDQFASHPNYYKLLVDFRVYDKAGNYAPQSAVQMNFPNDFNEIVGESLAEAQDTQKRLDADMSDLLDEIRYELKLGQEQFSDRDSDGDIDSWLDGLSIDDLIELLDFDDFDDFDSNNDNEKVKTKRRVDEVNKRLKQLGLSFNGTKNLAWTDERIDKYLTGNYYGSSNPKYAQAYISYITPKQFLNLTVGGKHSTLDMIERESKSYGDVDFKKLGDSSPMFLEISEGRVWSKVVGHEGRHRMYMLGKAGFERIPILIFDYSTKYTKEAKDEMKLIAQRYNDTDLISKSRNTSISDVIPFSQGNKEIIKEKFGTTKEADIHYSDREDNLDSRTLLTNALESVAQNDEEREKLAKYKSNIEKVNSYQFKLDAIRMQIRELHGLRDAERIASLREEVEKLEKKIDYYDRQLLRLEATEPLKKIASRAFRDSKRKAVSGYKDQIEKKAKVEGITQKALVLDRWLKTNSGKEHIIEPLKPAVVELVNAINFSSSWLLGKSGPLDVRGMQTNRDKSIAATLSNLHNMAQNLDKLKKEAQAEESFMYQLDLPEFLIEELKNLSEVANSLAEKHGSTPFVLNDMTLEDLNNLDKIVTELKTICSTANESFAYSEKLKISELSEKFMKNNDELSQKKMNNLATEYLEYDNSTPFYVLKRMGPVGRMMFDAFMDGHEKYAIITDKIEKDAAKIFKPEEAEEWSQKLIEVQILDTKTSEEGNPKYKTVQMTVSHAMSIYALSRREAAKPHLVGGGIRIKDFKLKKQINKITDAYGVTLSKSELEGIISQLDNRQKEVTEKLQEYMSTESAKLGNYVTMKRWGIKQFTENFYFPMETIKNGQNFDKLGSKNNSIYRLLNSNFTKPLTPNSNNKLVIDNIFDVFVAHTTDMAKYHSFALPMLDTIKILGYTKKEFTDLKNEKNGHDEVSVSASIINAFGEGGLKYIVNLMKDLNSVETTPRGEAIPKKLMSNYKVAAVGANLRVVLLQGTAYVKAAYNLEGKYLIKAMLDNGKKASEIAKEHSGLALWKSKGNYDLNISRSVASRIKQEQNFVEKVKEKSLDLAGKADERTWGHLWKACEYWAMDNTNFKKDSDEFYKAVSKRFREVIVSTQVVDSTLTRTQLMRSKSAMVQTMTAFMSESAMTYNMLSDAFFEWSLDARKEGKTYKNTFSKHGKKFAKSVMVWSLTNVATALAGAFVDAGRDDDEEKELGEKYLLSLVENLKDNFNPLGILPIFRDIKSISEGFSPTRYDMQSFATLYNAYKKWVKVIEGDGNVYQAAYKTIQGLSQASGMPFSNQIRDVKAMWNNSVGIVFPSLKFK